MPSRWRLSRGGGGGGGGDRTDAKLSQVEYRHVCRITCVHVRNRLSEGHVSAVASLGFKEVSQSVFRRVGGKLECMGVGKFLG